MRWKNLSDDEVLSIVVNLFLSGMDNNRIVTHMHEFYGETEFNREHPFAYLRKAGRLGMLAPARYDGRETVIEHRIRRYFPGLNVVEVAASVVAADVAERVARSFLGWGRNCIQAGRPALRVGLMGGGTIMAVCRALARILADLSETEKEKWPHLTFQALAVGDNVREPLEDPVSFFTCFDDPLLTPLRRRYVGVHAPVFNPRPAPQGGMEAVEFEQLCAEAKTCDIVLVSAGAIEDEHSFLGKLRATAPASWERLRRANCRGDLGRLPVSADGPLSLELFDNPPCTVIGLEDFKRLVEQQRRVVLVAAPCGDCGAHKGGIIQTLLGLRKAGWPLFTDLFCDSRSARQMPVLGTDPLDGGN